MAAGVAIRPWLLGNLPCKMVGQIPQVRRPRLETHVPGLWQRRRNDSLSLYSLNSSVSSLSTPVITRARAFSCSIRALCRSEFCIAFWYAVSAATRAGMSAVISRSTPSSYASPKISSVLFFGVLVADGFEDVQKFLHGGDDDLLAAFDQLPQVARVAGVADGGAHLGELRFLRARSVNCEVL